MPAPVVIGTIALGSASAKTIPVWVGIAVTAGMTALSVGYKFLTQPKGAKGISRRDWDSNVVSTEQHLPVVYGRARLGISPVFVSSGENAKTENYHNIDWLFCVAAICHGEIESIQRIILNNEGKHALVAKNENGELEIDEFYNGFVHFGKKTGKSTISKAYKEVQDAFPKWSDNHVGKGVASIYLNLRYNADKFPAGVPNVTVEIKGTKVHDPRDASYPNDTIAYTTNPALCVLDYLKNTVYGASATEDEIDKNSFIIAANYCDQLLSYSQIDPPSPVSAKLIEVDTELYTGSSQQYDYKYALGTLTNTSEYVISSWTVMSDLSAIASCTVTKAYGTVNLSGIANNASYSRVIFRKELATGTYKIIGSIDPDDDSTIFSDNIKETDLGDAHLTVGSPPSAPSGLVATFKNFTLSALDTLKYYRYKIVYKTATGTHTEASDASNKIKTKKSKNAVKLNIPVSEDTKTTSREIYRTSGFASGTVPAASDYKLLKTISNNTQEIYYDYLGSDADVTDNSDENLGPAEAPSTNNTTVSAQKMFTCNGIVDTSRDIMTNLEELLTSCRGRLFYESGKYSLSIRTTAVPEIFELTEDNIIGDWSYSTPGTKEVCNIIKASWINPDQNWQTDYVIWPPATDNNLYLGDDYGFKINKEIDLPFTTNRKTAKQIAQVTRKETRQTIAVSLTAKEEALKLKANTVVKITHSSPGWTDKLFWVDAIKILPNATVGLALTEYDSTVYNYELIAKDTVGGADTTLPNPNDPPDEVTDVVIVEEMYGLTPTQISAGQSANTSTPNWRLKVTYTNPASNFWHHSDVYIKKGSNVSSTSYTTEYIQAGSIDRNSNGVFYFAPVEPYITYYIKFVSVSDFGPIMLLDDATEWSHTIDPGLPKTVTSLQAINKGNDPTAEGKDFKISWAAVSRMGSGFANNANNASIAALDKEKITYDVEVYLSPSFTIGSTTYPGIADSVKFNNNTKVNTKLLNTYNTSETSFTYTYEKNIEDINNAFKNEASNINYEDFYGHSQRTLKFVVYTKNEWGKRTNNGNSIQLHNPPPTMTDIDGVTIIPTSKSGLSSLEFNWEHPFGEIDITHFMAKLVGKSASDSDGLYSDNNMSSALASTSALSSTKRKDSTAYNVGDFVFPKPANGHVYRCSAAIGNKKTASTQPVFSKPSDSNGAHPATTDGNVTWTHFCMLRFQKVVSTIDSEDDDISVTNYTAKFINVDPKKSFRFKTTAHDIHGAGDSSTTISATPGTTHDITEDEDIDKPIKVTGTDTGSKIALTINSNNNVVITWNNPSGSNTNDVPKAIIDWRARQGVTGTPLLTLRTADPAGAIPTLGDVDEGNFGGDATKLVIGEKKSVEINIDESEVHAKNRYVVKGAKVGYTYFARVRFENSSKKQGTWSDWNYNTTAVSGWSAEDVPEKWAIYKFTGSVEAVSTTTVKWTGGANALKRKANTGTTDKDVYHSGLSNYTGTPVAQTFTGTKFLVHKLGSDKNLYLVSSSDVEDDANQSWVVIAKIKEADSGKCNVLMMISSEHYRISAYEAGFNQLSSITADIGTVTAGTLTGTTIQTGTNNPKVLINSSGITVYNSSGSTTLQISNDGSGSIGDKISWTTGGVVTVSGVVADSVAAENIVAGTITGSTLRTAASGKRFEVRNTTLGDAYANEASFYGDEDGGAGESIVKLATIGITQTGSDYYIGDFGNINPTNTRGAIRARAYNGEAIQAQCGGSANAINANASSGHGISATSATGFGGQFTGNATTAPLQIVPRDYTTKPTTLSAGSLAFDSSINKLICYDGTLWQALW